MKSSKLLNVALFSVLLAGAVWGANTIGAVPLADVLANMTGTKTSPNFLCGTGAFRTLTAADIPASLNATAVVGALSTSADFTAASVNISTASTASNTIYGTDTAAFATNATGGTGQPANKAQACWIPITIDGVTTYVAGFR